MVARIPDGVARDGARGRGAWHERVPLVAVIVLLLAVAMGSDLLLASEAAPADASADLLILVALLSAQCAALWLGHRWIDRRGARLGPVPEVLASTAVAAAIYAVVVGGWAAAAAVPVGLAELWVGGTIESVMIVALWTLSVRYPAMRLRALEAERQQAAAEMADLRARLQPHFLMNSLNAIAACVGEDPARARRLIADLAELLRAAIHSEGHERPVRDEVAWLRRYGALLEARYDGDLVLAWHVDDAAAAEPIPPLLIQPLVENAILHGGDAPAPRRVDVAATVDAQGRLQLEVASDGVAPGTPGTGSGLSLVRRRLALWRPGATLSVVQQDGRTRALVAVPPHRAG